MKWGMALFILSMSGFAQADTNMPLTVALNEPDKLIEQRQAAVARLQKLLEQKRQGIKPVATHKATAARKSIKSAVTPKKPVNVAKVVESSSVVAAKKKSVTRKKINVAVVAWGGALIDDHHFERQMSNRRMADFMIKTVSDNLDTVLKTNNNYTKVISGDSANSIAYEGDDNSESKRACGQYKVEKVVMVALSRVSNTGSAEVVLFDCITGGKKTAFFDLDTTINERYYLEKDLSKELKKFYQGNIGLLS